MRSICAGHRRRSPPLDKSTLGLGLRGPWCLLELFDGFAATTSAVVCAPLVVALAAWGIATKRWHGVHGLGAYMLAVLNLRVATFFFIPLMVSTPGGGRAIVGTFSILFLVLIPPLYFVTSRRRNQAREAAAA